MEASTAVSPSAPASAALAPRLLRVAWLSILLGVGIEILVILVAVLSGSASGPKPFVADLAQKLSWSAIVCLGLAVGRTASRALPAAMGLAGLLAAPLGFVVARSLHKGATQALGMVVTAAPGPSPLTVALLKALTYAVLGVALAWVAKRAWGGAAAHAVVGLAVGAVFGGALLWLTVDAAPAMPLSTLLARGVNEVIFPAGCALVIYASETLGKRLA